MIKDKLTIFFYLMISKDEFKQDLEELFADFEWDIKGMIDKDDNIKPLPKDSKVFTLIFEAKGKEIIKSFACKHDLTMDESRTREYPDVTLKEKIFDGQMIAIDFKSAQKNENGTSTSKMTLGSFMGYFCFPNKKMAGCPYPYGKYSQHWVIGFIYKWDTTKDTLNIVSDLEVIINEKWKLSSKTKGSGNTANIGSITDIPKLKNGQGQFNTEKEFEEYWRNYAKTNSRGKKQGKK